MTMLDAQVDPGVMRDENLELKLAEFAHHPIHRVPTYQFHMIDCDSGAHVGGINLRVGSTPHIERYAGHVGYTVFPEYRGHRYAARSLLLLHRFALQLGIDPLWITCDPENAASRRTLELAGAEFVEVVGVPAECIIFQTGHPRKCRYRLDSF